MSAVGRGLVALLPLVIKFFGVVGTLALILVSGGIFVPNIDFFHHLFPGLPEIVGEFAFGFFVGLAVVLLFTGFKKGFELLRPKK